MSMARTLILPFTLFFLLFTIFWFTLHYEDLADALSSLDDEPIFKAQLTADNTQYSHQDFENTKAFDDQRLLKKPVFDEKNVAVLSEKNFSRFIAKNRYVMVDFYAPWCYWSKQLAPEYAAAATMLKGDAVLAKVDADKEKKLAQKYGIDGYPSLYFFIGGIHRDTYYNGRTRDAIARWVRSKKGPRVFNVTTTEEAKRILTAESLIVLGFFDSLEGPDVEELAAASKMQIDISFYQTASADVAKIFDIDPQIERPALIMLKKETEKHIHFDGQFTRLAISDFVSMNKFPSLTTVTEENIQQIQNDPKKRYGFLPIRMTQRRLFPHFKEQKLAKKRLLLLMIQTSTK